MQITRKNQIILTIILFAGIAFVLFFFTKKETIEELPPMTVQEKKERFRTLIVPAVNNVYQQLMEQYTEIKAAIDAGKSNETIEKLKIDYKVTQNHELLMAIKPHPKSITIAQAAMESSWATSRFFREANNIFGVWSFDENEPRIAALKKRGNKTIWVKKYDTIEDAIYDYYKTLGRSSAFSAFRETKMQTDDPFILVTKLERYSEKGDLYGEELQQIIRFNKFNEYDTN